MVIESSGERSLRLVTESVVLWVTEEKGVNRCTHLIAKLLYSSSDLVASGRYYVASTSQVVRKAVIVINPIVDVIWQ